MKADAPRVLIVKLSSLGDLFHALPAVHDLRTALSAEVHWVAQSEYVEVVRCFTDVTRVIPFPRREALSRFGRFVRVLRQEAYEYVIDLQGLLKSALVTALARGRRKIGPSFCREGSRWFYGEIAGPRQMDRHAVAQNLDVVRHLGLPAGDPVFPVAFREMSLPQPAPRVALVPVTRWPSKNWPARHYLELGRRLQAGGVSLFLLGGPDGREACREIEATLGGGVANLAGRFTLRETGGLLRQMDLLIGGDSGPVHMAAAVGTPTLALFAPTDPRRTGPYGPGHRVIRAPWPCRPCYDRRCRRHGVPCLQNVEPAQVAEAAAEMLGGGRTGERERHQESEVQHER